MDDSFNRLIEKTKEKYRISWEMSIKEYEKFCKLQDSDFNWAIKYGYFPPRIEIERISVTAKTRRLKAEYTLDWSEDKLSLYHPDVYKMIQDYENKDIIQRFFQKIKWGFGDLFTNFRVWKGHMSTEDDWDFWETLNEGWVDLNEKL
jgi:hypothetical protein